MKKVILFCVISVAVIFASIANAGQASGTIKLYEITHNTGRLAFTIDGFSDPSLGCNYPNQFAIHKADAAYKETLATLLSAKIANKPVKVYYNGCIGGAYINVIYVYL